MEKQNIILSSCIKEDGIIFIEIDEKYIIKDALDLTILEINDKAKLVSIEKTGCSTYVKLERKHDQSDLELTKIRLLFVDMLLENQIRFECINRFSTIRDKIFTAAFKPVELGK